MGTEHRFPNEGWQLVTVKRDWCPEWLYSIYSYLPPWLQPFKWLFNKKV